jgi:hypothetical protein
MSKDEEKITRFCKKTIDLDIQWILFDRSLSLPAVASFAARMGMERMGMEPASTQGLQAMSHYQSVVTCG